MLKSKNLISLALLANKSRLIKCLVAVLFISFPVTCATAAIYYVDFDFGSDTNSGNSPSTPWRTIPGTYNTAGTAYLNSTWGVFNVGANKVSDNTTIQVKSGTRHTSSAGGYIKINRDFYVETGCTNIVIQSDSSWGGSSGATLDGAGMSIGIALMVTQIDGLTVSGFSINNSTAEGLEAKEHQGGGYPLKSSHYYNLSFSNNGISYATDAAGSGAGQLSLRWPVGAIVSNCVFNGNQRYINGLLIGDDHKYPTNVTVISCISTNHKGDVINNDAGIGFKCFNSFVTFTNCYSANNLKGWDCGEAHGDDYPMNVKIISSTATRNYQGFNFNSAGVVYPANVNFYLINSLSVSNTDKGLRAYAGPFNLHAVHNVFDNNGGGDTVNEGCNFHVTADTQYETNAIVVRAYNNIMRRAGAAQMVVPYAVPTNQFTLDSDYNSYEQRASEDFCRWSYYQEPVKHYSYGANGPGKASGNWYGEYYTTTTPVLRGTGHFHSDANSKGTGASDPNLAPLNDDYVPTNSYAGLNLSTQPWFLPEMGIDRAGRIRVGWEIGAYEFSSDSPVISLSVTSLDFGNALVGASLTNHIIVRNVGGGTLAGTVSVFSPFGIASGGAYNLGAGLSQPVAILYSPTATGSHSQAAVFSGANGAAVTVSGSGVESILAPVVSAISQTGLDVDANTPGVQIYTGSVIQYSGSASDPLGFPVVWQWLYSVNGGPESIRQSGSGNVTNATFNYGVADAGNTYVWKLRVSNGSAVGEATLTVGVRMPPAVTDNLTFQADAGVVSAPFTALNGSISQLLTTMDNSGGRAVYTFNITNAGRYFIQAYVNAPNGGANSFFINNDAEPQDPIMIWDIPETSGFEQRIVSWRGNGGSVNNQYVPKLFDFAMGPHQIIIAGRENDTMLAGFSIIRFPEPPPNLRVFPVPQ